MPKYVCQNCGDTVNHEEEGQEWDCVICGSNVVPVRDSDVIPISELNDFIKKWENKSEDFKGSKYKEVRLLGSGMHLSVRGLKSKVDEYQNGKEVKNGSAE